MPLSLLLTQHFTLLTEGVRRKLDGWERLTDTFALVARRLRGAFLVGWFGTAVPVQGLDVVVRVTNLDALHARYRQVAGGNRGATGTGPNLTEPLLGAGGTLAGALAAPVSGMVTAMVLGSVLHGWSVRLFAGLTWITAGGLSTAALLVAGPLVALALLPQAFGGQAGDVVDLLGALAMLAVPLQHLWAQLSGREPARHPLLRQLLLLGDRLAALLAQVLGTVAVVVTRIGPQLYPAMGAARATHAAVGAITAAVRATVDSLGDGLALFLHGPASLPAVQTVVIRAVRALVTRLRGLVVTTLAEVVTIATARVLPTLMGLARWVLGAAALVKAAILDTPFVRTLTALRGLAAGLQAWSRRPGPPPKPTSTPSPWLDSFPLPASLRHFWTHATTPPPAPALPSVSWPPLLGPGAVGPVAELLRAVPFLAAPDPFAPDPFALDAGQRAAVGRFRRPPSVLGGLAQDLRRQRAADTGAAAIALADVLAGIRPYVDRSLAALAPGAAASVLPGIEGLLDRLDVALRGSRADFPVRDLPEPAEVRPVVGRLVVRGAADAAPDGERGYGAFVARLRRELDARAYVATAVGAGAR